MSTEAVSSPTRTRWVVRATRNRVPRPEPARSYPISRWYLRPAAGRLAAVLTPTRVRPVHLTACGLAAAAGAAAVLAWRPQAMPLAALLVLVYWFFDRADGQLARRQRTASAWGAWLDGNADELVDVLLHVAVAAVLAAQVAAPWPWWLLVAFLAGKYLLMYGLTLEEHETAESLHPRRTETSLSDPPATAVSAVLGSRSSHRSDQKRTAATAAEHVEPQGPWRSGRAALPSLLRRAYHLPGNADVRVHLLVLALATGYLAVELAWVAVYYNLRWLARYGLVARRLGGVR